MKFFRFSIFLSGILMFDPSKIGINSCNFHWIYWKITNNDNNNSQAGTIFCKSLHQLIKSSKNLFENKNNSIQNLQFEVHPISNRKDWFLFCPISLETDKEQILWTHQCHCPIYIRQQWNRQLHKMSRSIKYSSIKRRGKES